MKLTQILIVIAIGSASTACASDEEAPGDGWDVTEVEPSTGGPADAPGSDSSAFDPDHQSGDSDDGQSPEDHDIERTESVYVAAVYDVSEGEWACNGYDSGSDFYALALETAAGEILGWGSYVGDGIVHGGNDYGSTTPLDGDEPEDWDGYCPIDFNDDTVVTVGCGGWVGVEFLDDAGHRVALSPDADQQIRVFEYGIQCSTGTDDDVYDLHVCLDRDAVVSGDDASCEVQLILGAQGEQVADVSGF